MPIKHIALPLSIALLLPLTSRAADDCGQAVLKGERKDAATIQRLEREWSAAFLRGDTGFERCLLTPDFTEITRAGAVKGLSDELALAVQNQGKHLTLPPVPPITVMLHGDVAVAYVSVSRELDGKTTRVYNADYYLWEQGAWHAYFSQQTRYGD